MKEYFKNFTEKDISYMLYGFFLGDGSYRNGTLTIRHTNKQKFYVLWIKEICDILNLKYKIKLDFAMNTTLGEFTYSDIRIKVPKRFYFETLNKCFDGNNKKIISKYVLNNINIFGLLLWYLDDGALIISKKGYKTKRFAYFNTQCFTYDEHLLIQDFFKKSFNIDVRIHTDHSGIYKNKRYYRIYINAENFKKFFDLVRPLIKYIPKDFYYKFDMKYEINRLHSSKENAEKYNLTF